MREISYYPPSEDKLIPDGQGRRMAAMQTIGACLLRAMEDGRDTPGATYHAMPVIGPITMANATCSWLHETVHELVQHPFGYTIEARLHVQNDGHYTAFDMQVTDPGGSALATFASAAINVCAVAEIPLVVARAQMMLDGWFPEPFSS